ncbi:MAG: hypothetical protein WCT12_28470 [Verrucomicrobiota bacterium]
MNRQKQFVLFVRNAIHAIAPNLADGIESARAAEEYRRAIAKTGFQVPLPQFIKRSIIKKILVEHGCRILVETGTFLGDTPWTLRKDLDEIYTIELSPELVALARNRFRNYPGINIVEGDSGERLREIVPRLKSKTLFWLDGHYSAGITAKGNVNCPILAELETILTGCLVPWVILIDDARCFGGDDRDYPSILELNAYIGKYCPTASITVENDIIRVV